MSLSLPFKVLESISTPQNCPNLKMVRMKGLEPPRLSAPEPKSGASTSFATSALDALSCVIWRRWQDKLSKF